MEKVGFRNPKIPLALANVFSMIGQRLASVTRVISCFLCTFLVIYLVPYPYPYPYPCQC
jgi:hypothetical protein